MSDFFGFPSDPADMYEQYGFAILKAFDENQVEKLAYFAKQWLYNLLSIEGAQSDFPLEKYHAWFSELGVQHGSLFIAKNRHTSPDEEIKQLLINNQLEDLLHRIGVDDFHLWDEGLGWLGFRFIRPGFGDGYPFTRKTWGIAKKVISCWVPIIGYSSKETIAVAPGSHIKAYEKYLPEDQKFRKDEYRLVNPLPPEELFNPDLKPGEIIVFHPKLIHSEDVKDSQITRLNLEFRINPV